MSFSPLVDLQKDSSGEWFSISTADLDHPPCVQDLLLSDTARVTINTASLASWPEDGLPTVSVKVGILANGDGTPHRPKYEPPDMKFDLNFCFDFCDAFKNEDDSVMAEVARSVLNYVPDLVSEIDERHFLSRQRTNCIKSMKEIFSIRQMAVSQGKTLAFLNPSKGVFQMVQKEHIYLLTSDESYVNEANLMCLEFALEKPVRVSCVEDLPDFMFFTSFRRIRGVKSFIGFELNVYNFSTLKGRWDTLKKKSFPEGFVYKGSYADAHGISNIEWRSHDDGYRYHPDELREWWCGLSAFRPSDHGAYSMISSNPIPDIKGSRMLQDCLSSDCEYLFGLVPRPRVYNMSVQDNDNVAFTDESEWLSPPTGEDRLRQIRLYDAKCTSKRSPGVSAYVSTGRKRLVPISDVAKGAPFVVFLGPKNMLVSGIGDVVSPFEIPLCDQDVIQPDPEGEYILPQQTFKCCGVGKFVVISLKPSKRGNFSVGGLFYEESADGTPFKMYPSRGLARDADVFRGVRYSLSLPVPVPVDLLPYATGIRDYFAPPFSADFASYIPDMVGAFRKSEFMSFEL
jgi:hypothetical protein